MARRMGDTPFVEPEPRSNPFLMICTMKELTSNTAAHPQPLSHKGRGENEIAGGESAQPWRGQSAQRRRGIGHEGRGARILKAPHRDALPPMVPYV